MEVKIIADIFVVILGLCIGSFLNCVVYRLEQNKSFLKGRSFCPACKHELCWKDLFPVASWIFLGGKCRYCKEKISVQYPVVEIITGVIFLLISLQTTNYSLQTIINLAFWFYLASSLIIIFIYDLKHYLIPDKVLLPAIIIAFLFQVLNYKLQTTNYILAVAIAFGFFFALWAISRGQWMGFGDVKLAILLGLILGFPNIIVGLFLAFFIGSIIGIILMAAKKKQMKNQLPFGPFLIIGTFIAFFWGQNIINWYLNITL